MHFSARIIPGSGVAKKQNVPTLNLELKDVPKELAEGIYACRVQLDNPNSRSNAVMHFGPRPVHDLPRSCEVHLLDESIENPPLSITVKIVERIRDVKDFENTDALKNTIQNDILKARAILSKHY